jgi:hypothetical protein
MSEIEPRDVRNQVELLQALGPLLQAAAVEMRASGQQNEATFLAVAQVAAASPNCDVSFLRVGNTHAYAPSSDCLFELPRIAKIVAKQPRRDSPNGLIYRTNKGDILAGVP